MNQKDNNKIIIEPKADGFKFAVTALTAFGTILYVIYNYFQNIAVDPILYGYISILIPIMIVSSIFLILYVLIKGFSMEVEDKKKENIWKKRASDAYLITFFITIITLILILGLILLAIKPESSYYITIIFYIFILYLSIRTLFGKIFNRFIYCIIEKLKYVCTSTSNYFEKGRVRISLKQFSLYFSNKCKGAYNYIYFYREQVFWFLILIASSIFIYYTISNYNKPDYVIYNTAIEIIGITGILFGYLIYKKYAEHYSKWSILSIISFAIVVALLIYSASVTSFSFFAKGDVIIVMDSIYHKNGTPIPVLIKVTGPDTRLSIKLSPIFSAANSSLKDDIELTPENNPNKTKYLVGNSLGNGKYYVFINTSDLSEGYYELRSERSKYTQVDAKGFYLLNDSKNYRNSS